MMISRIRANRVAFIFTGSFMGLAYLVASNDALVVFNYFVSSVTIFGALTWVRLWRYIAIFTWQIR
jgi:amino acid permease